MKLPFNLGIKSSAIVAAIITAAVCIPVTATITSKINKRTQREVVQVYKENVLYFKDLAEKFGELPRYSVTTAVIVDKNKKGQMTITPTSNMEVREIVSALEEKLRKFPGESTPATPDTIKPRQSFWVKIKDFINTKNEEK